MVQAQRLKTPDSRAWTIGGPYLPSYEPLADCRRPNLGAAGTADGRLLRTSATLDFRTDPYGSVRIG